MASVRIHRSGPELSPQMSTSSASRSREYPARATDIRVVIPPKKRPQWIHEATGTWRQRNKAIKRIGAVGRRQWRKESGVHQQARAENGMFRYKRIIGDRLRAQHHESQKTEALIAVNVINRMTALGMPESAKIVA